VTRAPKGASASLIAFITAPGAPGVPARISNTCSRSCNATGFGGAVKIYKKQPAPTGAGR